MITSTTTGRTAPIPPTTPPGDRTADRLGSAIGGAARRLGLAAWMSLVGALAAPVAGAADFQTHRGEDLNILVVTGEIMPDDDERFLAEVEYATAHGEHAMVVLSSDGGALGAGMHMGLVIREAGLPTFVPEGERCASACALAWLAGSPRMTTASSEIGFHQPYDDSTGAMVASIEANAVVGHYIATIGMGPEVVSFAVSAPPDSMAWLTPTIAADMGMEILEIGGESEGGDAMAMLTERTPPVDEAVVPGSFVPVPVMRPLTAVEVASVSLTGTVDGTAPAAGEGLPLVTAFAPVDGAADPFEPLFADEDGEGGPPAGPDFLVTDEGFGSMGDAAIEEAMFEGAGFEAGFEGMPFEDEMIGTPADITPANATPADLAAVVAAPGIANVEAAVMDAVRLYGAAGPDALAAQSGACWRTMRASPTPRALQYCHVFDLVAAAVIDPRDPGDFAGFAVEVRLRAHREMIADALPADYASAWRDEAGMVVAAMDAN